MRRAGAALLGLASVVGAAKPKPTCGHKDNAGDCLALNDLFASAGGAKWTKNKGWGKIESKGEYTSVCDWHGVTCASGRVSALALGKNNLAGSLPASLGSLTELQSLDMAGTRPPGYGPHSCVATGATNFNNTAMPDSFWTLKKLQVWSMEYACIGGHLADSIGDMSSLAHILIHGNFISGTLPPQPLCHVHVHSD
jgi:hypothetical protein